MAHVHRHGPHLLYRFLRGSRAEPPPGSLPAGASGDVARRPDATRIRPMPGRPSLFPTPRPAPPVVGLTACLPGQERSGLTTFRTVAPPGGGARGPPGALAVHDRGGSSPGPRSRALVAQASQPLWLGAHHDVYRECPCVHHTLHPAPSPPEAGRDTVPSRCRRQARDCGSRVRGRWTGRYLPAHPRRILLIEQQVWSVQLARQSTLRPRVAAIN